MTHLIASWLVAVHTTRNERDCRLVALTGLAPDLDGLGMAADIFTGAIGRPPTELYHTYHHWLFHGVFGAVVTALAVSLFARDRLRVASLAVIVFHLHLLCDLIGSRGPSPADLWPIFYFGPFSREPIWLWTGQWALDGWQNRSIAVVILAAALWVAIRRGHSMVGVFSRRADTVFIGVLRKWQRQFRNT
jgi:inner membrane protein